MVLNVWSVELSGLIFVALALVWAVVLLPKALRQHDEVAQTRSVDRVSDSMRVLARREVVSEREARLVRTPPRAPAPKVEPVPAAPVPTEARVPRAPMSEDRVRTRIAAQRQAAAAAARRRRSILLLLVVVGVGVGVAAALGQLPLWAVAIPVVLTVGFLVLARVLVRRERARWDAELLELKVLASTSPAASTTAVDATVDQDASSDATELPAADVAELPAADVAGEASAEARSAREPAVVSGLDDTSSFPLGLLDDVTPTTDSGSLWDPLPVTLPTYVSKPRASRSVRTIDLQAPGVSSSGHDAASSALVADAATSAPPDDLPQRAVGS